jgi:hypothetical protein
MRIFASPTGVAKAVLAVDAGTPGADELVPQRLGLTDALEGISLDGIN